VTSRHRIAEGLAFARARQEIERVPDVHGEREIEAATNTV
jgi:hypothetical protein